VRGQIIIENTVLALAGTSVGLVLALAIAGIVGGIEVTMEFPWDLSSTPHFLPEATLDRHQTVAAPLELPWQLLLAAGAGGILAGYFAAVVALFEPPPQPWPLLRSE
jgi:putative ABC transport system permease protein